MTNPNFLLILSGQNLDKVKIKPRQIWINSSFRWEKFIHFLKIFTQTLEVDDAFCSRVYLCVYAFATAYCCGHFNDFCHATMQSEKDVTREEKSS